MPRDPRDLLEVLKQELKFVRAGDYSRDSSWRPNFIFEDSMTCFRHFSGSQYAKCSECVLFQLVPKEKAMEQVPCRHIPLDRNGATIESLYRTASRAELISVLEKWLLAKIGELESLRAHAAPQE